MDIHLPEQKALMGLGLLLVLRIVLRSILHDKVLQRMSSFSWTLAVCAFPMYNLIKPMLLKDLANLCTSFLLCFLISVTYNIRQTEQRLSIIICQETSKKQLATKSVSSTKGQYPQSKKLYVM